MVEHGDFAFAGFIGVNQRTMHKIGGVGTGLRQVFFQTEIGGNRGGERSTGAMAFQFQFLVDEFGKEFAVIVTIRHGFVRQVAAFQKHGARTHRQ